MLLRLAIVVVILAGLLPVASAAEEQMDRPAWALGDEWDFFVTGQHNGPQGPEPFAYVGKMVVTGRERITVAGEEVDTLRIVELNHDVPGTDTAADWAGKPIVDYKGGAGFLWIRESDGFTMKRMRYHIGPDGEPQTSTDLVYPGGCDDYAWPYFVGRNSTATCTQDGTMGGRTRTVEFNPRVRVDSRANVTVPAGTFETFVVDAGVETPEGPQFGERQYYAPEACWRVKSEGLGGNPIRMELLAYRCGSRSGGVSTTLDPPIDLDRLGMPSVTETPGPGMGLVVVMLGAVALAVGRPRPRL